MEKDITKEDIVERLVQEGTITFKEGLVLMEKEYIYTPYYSQPYTYPYVEPIIYTGTVKHIIE